ncbi:hypothetical protein Q5P01_018490 [Channa striata]|uniref:UPAR/Ly6 domain-containing protein n=1 Tax=Channa striata TaxID=64152 RepID=A0AA88SFZ8_CHASR|nr:hypothetical protein Q5P01_018490 [Channa striata]
MTKLLWGCAALLTLFVTVESLSCYKCDVEIFSSCLKKAQVNCTGTQNTCYTAVANFSADFLTIYDRGCIAESECKNQTGSVLNVNYTITRRCCNTNLCNAASPLQLPLTAALCAALVAFWSQWIL